MNFGQEMDLIQILEVQTGFKSFLEIKKEFKKESAHWAETGPTAWPTRRGGQLWPGQLHNIRPALWPGLLFGHMAWPWLGQPMGRSHGAQCPRAEHALAPRAQAGPKHGVVGGEQAAAFRQV
jgi:hypothetical protein